MKKQDRLEMWEWSLIFMSIRYAMGRQTIASATLPAEIIEHFYDRMSDGQKDMLVRDMSEHLADFGVFGSAGVDNPIWQKFLACLDYKKHQNIEMVDGTTHRCFLANGRIYPLKEYLNCPSHEIYVPTDSIKEATDERTKQD